MTSLTNFQLQTSLPLIINNSNEITLDKKFEEVILNPNLEREEIQKKLELMNTHQNNTAAFYTDKKLVFNIVNLLPNFNDTQHIQILEPSVGVGSFLWEVANRYSDKTIQFVLIDINIQSLLALQLLLKRFPIENAEFKFIHSDFFDFPLMDYNFDLIIGNPPFGKVKNKLSSNYLSNNLATMFLEKIIKTHSFISLVLPKSIISAPSFRDLRTFLERMNVRSIIDFGENGFKGVKIETINIMIDINSIVKTSKSIVRVISLITNTDKLVSKQYIFDKFYPYWLLYRDEFFDTIAKKLDFNVFNVFRDRQITKKITHNSHIDSNFIWVLRSRNFPEKNTIIHIDNYDRFINYKENTNLQVLKYINKDVYLMPNLSYKPRSMKLPKNTIVDGSLALLIPKSKKKPTKSQLDYYSSDEYRKFYKIARNFGTRSLNIDTASVFFFGLIKD